MNQFETRMNALRLQFKAERISLQKAAQRHIGHLTTSIGEARFPEAADAIRDARRQAKEALRNSMAWNRLCYRQQLEQIEDEYRLHLAANPSKRSQRQAI